MAEKLSTEEVMERIALFHGDDFELKGVLKNIRDKVLFLHKSCGREIKISPQSLMKGHACWHCYLDGRHIPNKGDKKYKKELSVKNNKIIPLEQYQGAKTCIKHRCTVCSHDWLVTPDALLNSGTGCRQCAIKNSSIRYMKSHEVYEKEIAPRHIIPIEPYQGGAKILSHKCLKCDHQWKARPGNILSGCGCPKCFKKGYSLMAIRWMDLIAKRDNISIRHAHKGGELSVFIDNKTRVRVDGYCKKTNTVYEFYGDAYHGNLDRYNINDKPHPYDRTITAGQLWIKTKYRELILKKLGYSIVSIWESEFKRTL